MKSVIIKWVKTLERIAKFQINDCLKILHMHAIYYFIHFLKEICQNQPFPLFNHVYLNSAEVKFQILITQ